MRRAVIFIVFACIACTAIASANLTVFQPSYGGLSATNVYDWCNGPDGEVVAATARGLSVFDGENWTTYHRPAGYVPESLISETILSVEYGPDNTLWLGTTLGLQSFDGQSFHTLATQDQLKNPAVIALQRWDDAMWVETRNSGVHRVEGGNWTWYKPFAPGSPASYALEDMALDPEGRYLYCLSKEGLWAIEENSTGGFSQVTMDGMSLRGYEGIRTDPFGGVYLFNRSQVVHLDAAGKVAPVLGCGDFERVGIRVQDLGAAPDGALWVATNYGIFCWKNLRVVEEIGRPDGIWARSIKTVFPDQAGRCWFSTSTCVGYSPLHSQTGTAISFVGPARWDGNLRLQ
ncbi:ligand-binding sensor domain-containing protein [Methanofollis sp. W23]|uniref:hypothetical protein n=1 Tax=Methanofollis sp. W23 TaxID=2817849 RepID=UPI001AE20349|nr:hypothetical protein [Methanofollis sp. W23]MBP2145191.1 ligand-binding sensor domain-containing protein [Methanofollis sp. W23]